jgi:hypothetical protein
MKHQHILGLSAGFHDAAATVIRSDGEIVFLRYAGSEITKFGREYITATVDGQPTQIRPDGGVIQFRIDA